MLEKELWRQAKNGGSKARDSAAFWRGGRRLPAPITGISRLCDGESRHNTVRLRGCICPWCFGCRRCRSCSCPLSVSLPPLPLFRGDLSKSIYNGVEEEPKREPEPERENTTAGRALK